LFFASSYGNSFQFPGDHEVVKGSKKQNGGPDSLRTSFEEFIFI
jgi:hypothetical protein